MQTINTVDEWLRGIQDGYIGIQLGNKEFIYIYDVSCDKFRTHKSWQLDIITPRSYDILKSAVSLAKFDFVLVDNINDRDAYVDSMSFSRSITQDSIKNIINNSQQETKQHLVSLKINMNSAHLSFEKNLKRCL